MNTNDGATLIGFIDQIVAEVSKRENKTNTLWFDKKEKRKACVYLAKVLKEAIGEVIIASKEVMEWFQNVSEEFNEEHQEISWTTPTGFKPLQRYVKQKSESIQHYSGVRKIKFNVQRDLQQIDNRKQISSISPNIIHSLDAAHLQLTVLACPDSFSFAFIHDSFGCHASDLAQLHKILREEFVKIYNQPVLDNLRKEFEDHLGRELNPEIVFPTYGQLEISEVLQSRYFFS